MTGEVPADLLGAIVADAAGRLRVTADQVEVLQAEQVIWNDGSLGCPRPGESYTQALVPGYRVVVGAGGDELDYRATERGTFIVCDSPIP